MTGNVTSMSTNATAGHPGPGRPRLVDQRRTGANPREEILDAASELFTRNGYAGTSTRRIADEVGMRQASLYHHFATKDDILAALLQTTVESSLVRARELLESDDPALDRLIELARFDVTQLAASRWNLGALYLLPELHAPRFTEFRDARTELARAYETLATATLNDSDDTRALLPFRLVESVIMMRSDEQRGELGERTVTDLVDTIVGAIRILLEH